eukprot:GHUV01057091.1.p2 GENE.GHUV01057091.1~~GHUV01057091.1.p2  ORF type:complete len:181 (+),score=26.08 GHUV01057091.1:435-977(+)
MPDMRGLIHGVLHPGQPDSVVAAVIGSTVIMQASCKRLDRLFLSLSLYCHNQDCCADTTVEISKQRMPFEGRSTTASAISSYSTDASKRPQAKPRPDSGQHPATYSLVTAAARSEHNEAPKTRSDPGGQCAAAGSQASLVPTDRHWHMHSHNSHTSRHAYSRYASNCSSTELKWQHIEQQ